jgi:hypothetical protein
VRNKSHCKRYCDLYFYVRLGPSSRQCYGRRERQTDKQTQGRKKEKERESGRQLSSVIIQITQSNIQANNNNRYGREGECDDAICYLLYIMFCYVIQCYATLCYTMLYNGLCIWCAHEMRNTETLKQRSSWPQENDKSYIGDVGDSWLTIEDADHKEMIHSSTTKCVRERKGEGTGDRRAAYLQNKRQSDPRVSIEQEYGYKQTYERTGR